MSGGQDRDDESDTNRACRLDRDENSRIAAHHSPRNKRACAAAGVCAKEIKNKLNSLDSADFVRDVAKSASHHLSQGETPAVGNVGTASLCVPSSLA